jgi:hypothetical protein
MADFMVVDELIHIIIDVVVMNTLRHSENLDCVVNAFQASFCEERNKSSKLLESRKCLNIKRRALASHRPYTSMVAGQAS